MVNATLNSANNQSEISDKMKSLLYERRISSKKENFVLWEQAKKQFRFGN